MARSRRSRGLTRAIWALSAEGISEAVNDFIDQPDVGEGVRRRRVFSQPCFSLVSVSLQVKLHKRRIHDSDGLAGLLRLRGLRRTHPSIGCGYFPAGRYFATLAERNRWS